MTVTQALAEAGAVSVALTVALAQTVTEAVAEAAYKVTITSSTIVIYIVNPYPPER